MDNPLLTYKSKKEGPHVIPANLKMLLRRDEQGSRYYLDEQDKRIYLPAAEGKAIQGNTLNEAPEGSDHCLTMLFLLYCKMYDAAQALI